MEIVETGRDSAVIRVTRQDLSVLANALNETREALEEWEYSTRVGASPADADELQMKLKALLATMK